MMTTRILVKELLETDSLFPEPASPAGPRRPASAYPHNNQGTLAGEPGSDRTQSHPAGLPAVGPPCPDSGSPAFPCAGPLRSESPSHDGGQCSQNHGTSLLHNWHFNVGGLDVSPNRSSSSSCARSCNASGHLDHHSWTDCLPCSQPVQPMVPSSAHLGTVGHWKPLPPGTWIITEGPLVPRRDPQE